MTLDNRFNYEKAESGPFYVCSGLVAGTVKPFENTLQVGGCDTDAVVFYKNIDARVTGRFF